MGMKRARKSEASRGELSSVSLQGEYSVYSNVNNS